VLDVSQNPVFSVIVPHYDDVASLSDCIASLVAQSLPETQVELIVVDDCSPCDISSMLSENFPRVKLIRHSVNRGPAAARNTGIAEAKGQILAFVDSDANVPFHWLRNYLDAFERGAEVACGSVFHGERLLEKATAISAFGAHLKIRSGTRLSFAAANFAIRTDIMAHFTFSEVLEFAGEDLVLSQQIIDAGHEIVYVDKSWVRHKPDLTFFTYLRRAYRYGKGFGTARTLCQSLPGYFFHKYFKGLSGFLLMPARIGIDVHRTLKYGFIVRITALDLPLTFGLFLAARLAWAAGVAAGYTSRVNQ
jgi:mycofactocin glycosyltransferase